MMNLMITCARHFEPDAEDEIRNVLDELGDSEVKVSISSMSGIITAETKINPIDVVCKIRERLLDEPWSIRYCLRIIPIQKVVETKIEEIEKSVSDFDEQIPEGETYRILIEKRNSNISSHGIITKIANKIKNKVNLDFPDKIILVEILGNKTGISILRKQDILSTEKTKRSISE